MNDQTAISPSPLRSAARTLGPGFARIAPSAPGKAKSAEPIPSLPCTTIRSVIYAPATLAPAASRTRPIRSVFAFTTTTLRFCPTAAPIAETGDPLAAGREERGVCRVLCFHPDHSLTLAGMQVPDIVRVVEAWTDEFTELAARPEIRHVQIFENRGAMMGASNPHPHGQIWATEHIPDEAAAEVGQSKRVSPAARCLPALRHSEG